ncbi:putative ferric-chelate reductase 1 [Osmerus eperlanus]|uniref:putative ferric-chelate reductase 1 n=1 Tax=Osmerus eperlanus TaxID=29151 RepID=UPI002E15DE7B
MFRPTLILACIVQVVRCYPTGSVLNSCLDMRPVHGGTAQQSTPPFTITTDRTSYEDGVVITVNLQASTQFKGFMLQAREVGSNNNVGSFSTMGSGTRLLDCNGVTNSALVHSSGTLKNAIQGTWKAPDSGSVQSIQFSASLVRDTKTYWVSVKGPLLRSTNAVSNSSSSSSSSSSYSSSLSISSAECGIRKVCFSQPPNCDPNITANCFFMSAMMPSPNITAFQFELAGASTGYVAMGFSDDQIMGSDDIYICGLDNKGVIQLQHFYSTGRKAPGPLPLGNVSQVNTGMSNGVISCSFASWNPISTQRSAGSSTTYYLMFVYGTTNGGQIQIHSQTFVSDRAIDISNPQLVEHEVFPDIIKAHGCLMLISWMTTGSLGMLIARYLKGLAKGTQYWGKDVWFVSHVSLMSLSVVATSIAFILAFSFAKDWAGGAHPVLGCLVMILALLQPTAAIFRCGPHHHWRFIFNWAHAINALVMKILAVAAIFTGLELIESSEDSWMPKVMGGFVGWEALFFILMEINSRCNRTEGEDVDSKSTSMKGLLLLLFFLGNIAFLVALLVGIGMTG